VAKISRIARRLQGFGKRIERIICKLGTDPSGRHTVEEIPDDVWFVEDAETDGVLVRPEHWRKPPRSRQVH
jgi:hypothetical protein